MKVHESSEIRNVALIGHGHAGKTSLACALLHTAGVTERLTRPDEGNAMTDFDEEEIYRKISISSSLAAIDWQKNKLNLIDTPGYNIFLSDTQSAMLAADSAVLVLDGVAGVEVSSEKVWKFADDFHMPCTLFVNKLDRERSNFTRVVESVHERFGRSAIPVHLPIGSEREFNGVIDLIRMRAYCYSPGGNGKGKEMDIPAPYEEAATAAHEALVEMVAEGKDELMEEFFATGTLPAEHIISGLQEEMRERRVFPILCGSASQNIGLDLLLNFMTEVLPSPLDGIKLAADDNGKEVERGVAPADAPAVFVFKTLADPFAGRLSYFKVMSGSLKTEAPLVNMRTNQTERLSHLSVPLGKTVDPDSGTESRRHRSGRETERYSHR